MALADSTAPGAGRDRDDRGRARSARPRDGLGRPLPRGSAGVVRLPEGVVRTPAQSLATAQQLLDDGLPFHAHEVLEDAWKAAPEPERELWRGLAQYAVGLTHEARGNTTGAAALLRRAAVSLHAYDACPPHGIPVPELVAWCRRHADEVTAPSTTGGAHPAPPLTGTEPGRR